MREFLEMASGLARDGKMDKAGRPKNPLQLATFVLGLRHVFYVTAKCGSSVSKRLSELTDIGAGRP